MEKKKRVRPTWTQVKELEQQVADLKQKLAEQTEALHERCVEADGWREKYRELKARLTEAEETQNIGGEPAYVSALRRELERVMRRNQQLSDEVKESTDMVNRMRMEKGKVAKLCDERLEEIIRMKNRGLWARIWNK